MIWKPLVFILWRRRSRTITEVLLHFKRPYWSGNHHEVFPAWRRASVKASYPSGLSELWFAPSLMRLETATVFAPRAALCKGANPSASRQESISLYFKGWFSVAVNKGPVLEEHELSLQEICWKNYHSPCSEGYNKSNVTQRC